LFQTFNPDSVRLFTAVWTRDTDPEVQLYTSPADSIRFKNIELGGQGFRLVGLTSVGFEPTDMASSGVWRQPPPGTPPEPTVSLIGVDSQTFQDWYYQLVSNGFGVKLLHVEGLA
jgi:hypothetical protein